MRSGWLGNLALGCVFVGAQACGNAEDGGQFGDNTNGGSLDGGGGMTGSDSTTGGSTTGGDGSDGGPGDDSGSTTGGDTNGKTGGSTGECGSIQEAAEVERSPADVVIAIDTSGSMFAAFCGVSQNLATFADGVGPETRVATVYQLGGFFRLLVEGVCGGEADPFQGSALAADAERYRRVEASVGSHDVLQVLLDQYDAYASHLRPGSPTHFIIVTDDDSNLDPQAFRTQMEANLGRSFYFHTISYLGDNMGNLGCGESVEQRYLDLAAATGGEQLSVCASDWSALFAELEEAVERSSPLPCSFAIPEPPPGQTFSPDKVSVVYTPPGSSSEQYFSMVSDADACEEEVAWHFDDPSDPTRIEFCPEACALVGEGGELGLDFDCKSPVLL